MHESGAEIGELLRLHFYMVTIASKTGEYVGQVGQVLYCLIKINVKEILKGALLRSETIFGI